jgi:hypothetical protein
MGGLCFPSEDVYKTCLKAEAVIRKYRKEKGHVLHTGDVNVLKITIFKSRNSSEL